MTSILLQCKSEPGDVFPVSRIPAPSRFNVWVPATRYPVVTAIAGALLREIELSDLAFEIITPCVIPWVAGMPEELVEHTNFTNYAAQFGVASLEEKKQDE